MAAKELPSFDLVVATVDRVDEPHRLLASLSNQTYQQFRVLLVDQNDDDRLGAVVREHPSLDLERLRSSRGLSRARNVALGHITADVVAFPDDDCVYASDLLERVAGRLAEDTRLDGLTGRATDARGQSSPSWASEGAVLTRENLWNRAISFTIFLRSRIVAAVGTFDERLGLGSGTPWSSGEETEYLVRAVDAGAWIEYDPDLVVAHDDKASPESRSEREGASLGYILRKHKYPARSVARMIVRPAGGAILAVLRNDRDRARFHASTLRGRVLGYRRATNS